MINVTKSSRKKETIVKFGKRKRKRIMCKQCSQFHKDKYGRNVCTKWIRFHKHPMLTLALMTFKEKHTLILMDSNSIHKKIISLCIYYFDLTLKFQFEKRLSLSHLRYTKFLFAAKSISRFE